MYYKHQILKHRQSQELVIFRGTYFVDPVTERVLISLMHRDGKLREDFVENYCEVFSVGSQTYIAAMPTCTAAAVNDALDEVVRLGTGIYKPRFSRFNRFVVGRTY